MRKGRNLGQFAFFRSIPVILLSDGLCENTSFSIHCESFKVCEIDIQSCQSISFNFLELRKVEIVCSESAGGCTRVGARCVWIKIIFDSASQNRVLYSRKIRL